MTRIWGRRGDVMVGQTHRRTERRSLTGVLNQLTQRHWRTAMVEMHFVDSSNVEQIGYDSAAMELHVRFLKTPELYVYLNVPEYIFQDLMAAPSKGSFINREIKNVFKFERR
jgi:hypothetical protein